MSQSYNIDQAHQRIDQTDQTPEDQTPTVCVLSRPPSHVKAGGQDVAVRNNHSHPPLRPHPCDDRAKPHQLNRGRQILAACIEGNPAGPAMVTDKHRPPLSRHPRSRAPAFVHIHNRRTRIRLVTATSSTVAPTSGRCRVLQRVAPALNKDSLHRRRWIPSAHGIRSAVHPRHGQDTHP